MAESTNASNSQPGRSNSFSQHSDASQTAQEYIASQLQLEDDAREVLPYQFDTCSQPLGPLRQNLWSCLTCNPPPADPSESYTPAAICYSCHVSCHGEHTLVELFGKRNMVCDCGTTRIQSGSPCTLRINSATGTKGDVRGEEPAATNHYDQNYRNRFCGCGQDYNAYEEKGTMFQCLGLGNVEDGGCGEDWWHPECLVGLPRGWHKKNGRDGNETTTDGAKSKQTSKGVDAVDGAQVTNSEEVKEDEDADDEPLPPGFPGEDDFEHFICYKCVAAFPWIKRYASAPGFLPPIYHKPEDTASASGVKLDSSTLAPDESQSRKRKASEDEEVPSASDSKRQRTPQPNLSTIADRTTTAEPTAAASAPKCNYATLPLPPKGTFSLFLATSFRECICRCPTCYPSLRAHPHLLDEEDVYEPPISESSSEHHGNGTGSIGSRSLLDRGEAALSNVDRVRAIEGVMVYNHLKEKVKGFLKPFADSGKPVGAEDIKAYFERLRGDEEGIAAARASGMGGEEGGSGDRDGDGRKEQSGY